jgi:meso-butanediol dehydrogenase / (S,S)-butanediol dehydrogenase / diacetyl reductase
MRLTGKVAVITGAASGIGRAAALLFAQEGARVVAADWHDDGAAAVAAAIAATGGQATAVTVDVSREADIERMIATAVEVYGRLDVLFSNAGVMLSKTAVDTTEAELDRVLGVNVKGVFFGAKHAVKQFRRQGGGGAIINMASVNSFFAEEAIAAYCASKGAILQLTRALAVDHGREGIRVNCICPGWIDTPMNTGYLESVPDPAAARAAAGALAALNRIGQPEEIARAALFLASDDASFATGAPFIIDGGFSAGLPPKG